MRVLEVINIGSFVHRETTPQSSAWAATLTGMVGEELSLTKATCKIMTVAGVHVITLTRAVPNASSSQKPLDMIRAWHAFYSEGYAKRKERHALSRARAGTIKALNHASPSRAWVSKLELMISLRRSCEERLERTKMVLSGLNPLRLMF
jgi:hypothetical protein